MEVVQKQNQMFLIQWTPRRKGGKTFYGCNRYPECEFAVWQRPAPEACPACGSLMTYQAGGDTKCTSCGEVVKAEPAAAGS